jgi:HPt (histidine-containing phosphotransfer) domain-containing protein
MSTEQELAPTFDHSYFDQYTSGDEDLQREVIGLFFTQVKTLMADLKPEGTPGEWRGAAHAIKGGAKGLGLVALGNWCEQLEALKEATLEVKASALEETHQVVSAARLAVAARYDGLLEI